MSVIARETGKLVGGELGAAVYFRIGQLEHSRRTVFGEDFYLPLQSSLAYWFFLSMPLSASFSLSSQRLLTQLIAHI